MVKEENKNSKTLFSAQKRCYLIQTRLLAALHRDIVSLLHSLGSLHHRIVALHRRNKTNYLWLKAPSPPAESALRSLPLRITNHETPTSRFSLASLFSLSEQRTMNYELSTFLLFTLKKTVRYTLNAAQ